MDFQQTRRYIGNLEQLFTVKEYRLSGGAADGMRLVDIDDGAGLALTLAPDRGLDIYKAAFKGVNLGFITPTGARERGRVFRRPVSRAFFRRFPHHMRA